MMQLFSKMHDAGFVNLGEYNASEALTLFFENKAAGKHGFLVRAETLEQAQEAISSLDEKYLNLQSCFIL